MVEKKDKKDRRKSKADTSEVQMKLARIRVVPGTKSCELHKNVNCILTVVLQLA